MPLRDVFAWQPTPVTAAGPRSHLISWYPVGLRFNPIQTYAAAPGICSKSGVVAANDCLGCAAAPRSLLSLWGRILK